MGVMNLLKANWTGKVGQTVGAKWKNKSTIRTYSTPAYTDTPNQRSVRSKFSALSKVFSQIAMDLKPLSPLPLKGMSLRNELIKLNKDQFSQTNIRWDELIFCKGGLNSLTGFTCTAPAGLASLSYTWNHPAATNLSTRAMVVIVSIDEEGFFGIVGSSLYTTGTLTIPTSVPPGIELNSYAYVLDYRGSSKVGSDSVVFNINTPNA